MSFEKMAISKRIEWLDLCKCIGIILVIVGHCPLSPSKIFYFYAFHIPLFFILAGYTLNVSCATKEYVIKKIKSLIVPYFAFSIICLLFNYTMGLIAGDAISLKEEWYKILFNQRANHLWFLLVLFFSDLAIFFAGKMRLLSNAAMATVSLCAVLAFACFFVDRYSMVLYWNLDIVPVASVFVLVGYIYRHFIEPKVQEANRWQTVAVCILATAAILANFLNYSVVDIFKGQYGNMVLFFLGAILGSYTIVLICKQLPPHLSLR